MNVMVAVSWHTFPAQSCHIGNAPGRSGDILKARPRQPRTHRAWRQSPRCTGVARLVASLKGKVRQYNNNAMIPLVTAGQQTVTNMLPVLGPCDSDSDSLLTFSCVWILVSMMVTWCLQQVQSHCRVRSVEWCRHHAAMFVLSVLCTPAAQCQCPVTTCVMWRPIAHNLMLSCSAVCRQFINSVLWCDVCPVLRGSWCVYSQSNENTWHCVHHNTVNMEPHVEQWTTIHVCVKSLRFIWVSRRNSSNLFQSFLYILLLSKSFIL